MASLLPLRWFTTQNAMLGEGKKPGRVRTFVRRDEKGKKRHLKPDTPPLLRSGQRTGFAVPNSGLSLSLSLRSSDFRNEENFSSCPSSLDSYDDFFPRRRQPFSALLLSLSLLKAQKGQEMEEGQVRQQQQKKRKKTDSSGDPALSVSEKAIMKKEKREQEAKNTARFGARRIKRLDRSYKRRKIKPRFLRSTLGEREKKSFDHLSTTEMFVWYVYVVENITRLAPRGASEKRERVRPSRSMHIFFLSLSCPCS